LCIDVYIIIKARGRVEKDVERGGKREREEEREGGRG
jgi:hypothetical protein